MPHIHTKNNQHDLTVTAYVIRTDTSEPQALVHMHKKLAVLLPVGGHVELLETPWQAMAHELEEEAGYQIDHLQILQPKSRIGQLAKIVQHPQPLFINTYSVPEHHFHTDVGYAFVTVSGPLLEIGEGESTDIRWLTQTELNNLDSSLVFGSTKQIYNFIFDEALKEWDQVTTDTFLLDFPQEYR